MPKASYRRPNNSNNGDNHAPTDSTTTTNYPKFSKRICVMMLLATLPIPFLFGIFFGGTKFILQEVKLQGLGTSIYSSSLGTRGADKSARQPSGPSESLVQLAIDFVAQREQAYEAEEIHPHWKMRGHGHLYTYQSVILAAHIENLATGNNNTLQMGVNSVLIYNVHPQTRYTYQDCHLFTLWARVAGPEIFAGKPFAVHTNSTSTSTPKCYWRFDFDLRVPGTYKVDAKMVHWNGMAKVKWHEAPDFKLPDGNPHPDRFSQCANVYPGMSISQEAYRAAPQNNSIMGFKLYSPLQGCCEICRRVPYCQYWATPPHQFLSPGLAYNGCELFFDSTADPVEDVLKPHWLPKMVNRQYLQRAQAERAAAKRAADAAAAAAAANNTRQRHRQRHRRLGPVEAWGSPQSDNPEVSHFIGCGWSFLHTLEFPCLSGDLDDQIVMEETVFEAKEAAMTPPAHELPFCELSDEFIRTSTNAFSLKNRQLRNSTAAINFMGRWVRETYPTIEQCPMPYKISEKWSNMCAINAPDPDRPHCWLREDLTPLNKQCKEVNCDAIKPNAKWNATALQHERDWMAAWKNYHCDYQEFTDRQLSQCFQQLKIYNFEMQGSSISVMLRNYFGLRLENVTLYSDTAPDRKNVIVTTLHWPHLLWHMTEEEWELEFAKSNKAQDFATTGASAFWITPFFPTSEREPYVNLERALKLADMTERILTLRGYKMINVLDASAALTYDTGGQGDGLHILGPPMKLAITKVFHHLCHGVVEGSRV